MFLENIFVPIEIKKGEHYDRLKKELESGSLHPKILVMLNDLGYWTWRKFKRKLVVTHVFRSQEKQEQIYGKGTKKVSPHMFWRAVDVIVEGANDSFYDQLEAYLDARYPYEGSAGYTTADPHNVGLGMHLHIQVGFNEPFLINNFEKSS